MRRSTTAGGKKYTITINLKSSIIYEIIIIFRRAKKIKQKQHSVTIMQDIKKGKSNTSPGELNKNVKFSLKTR